MLKTSQLVKQSSVERLVKLWAQRYVPYLSTLSSIEGELTPFDLIAASSREGRIKTVAEIRRLVQIHCERAGMKTNALFSYVPNVVNLAEARRLAQFGSKLFHLWCFCNCFSV